MNKYNNFNRLFSLFLVFSTLLFASCIKETLDTEPKLSFSETNVFANFASTQTYALGFYSVFEGYDKHRETFNSEFNGDLLFDNAAIQGSDWIWGRITVPATSGLWNFSTIRRVNLMLENIEKSGMSEIEINHWRSVGYFFRALDYHEKLLTYGDVPWIDTVVSDTDEAILYASRTPRSEVAAHVLEDLLYAEEHILEPGTNGIPENRIGKDAVRVLLSRFGLYEGTWRKYHGLGGEDTYLRASANAAEQLIDSHPNLHPNYDELFNSEDLSSIPGIILYKQYEVGILQHDLTFYFRSPSATVGWDLTKSAMNLYLMQDGQTRYTSPLFDGELNPYDEFRNRDYRLYYTVTPPYRVDLVSGDTRAFEYTGNPQDREYMDLMASISDETHKLLPERNRTGQVLHTAPHFYSYNEGNGNMVTKTGYRLWKYYNRDNDIRQHTTDAPIFRMGEILVNYAEAKWELGEFDQSVADLTINKLRARGHVADMVVANIDAGFDPSRDATVDPVLWEIRRERAVELMCENFRFNDLRRWKKMDAYAGKEKLGMYIVSSDYDDKIPIQNGATEGYISYFGTPPVFPDYYYLYPIPSDQIVLNPNIEQNPGWGE
ncbi:RagB/SusD family nutrient uptake outer membrane protein [Tenacibaculum sp.]|uniref:RagB/SusD family nutrient uptake outer membrane protein n=1 Tax=Tenacibaculum sp. TaxID=1906242 RepID=UPI003D0FB342